MKICPSVILLLLLLSNCNYINNKASEADEPHYWVGDIPYDPNTDNSNFTLCDPTQVIHRRNGLTFPGGKIAIKKQCLENYKSKSIFQSFNGYIMVRFIINCKKETDRFRVQVLDYDFSIKECPNELTEHILSIVKGLQGWEPVLQKDSGSDFSKYLNFKIKDGQIENILQ